MNVSECMAADPANIGASDCLAEAARVMQENDTGFLPVVDDGRLVGVLTDRDIVVRGLAENLSPFETPVRDIMSIEVVCCFPSQSVDEAKTLMDARQIRRLAVIDDQHRVIGILTRDHLGLAGVPKKAPVKVTFSKEKTDSYGRPHKVPIKTVYITSTAEKEAAVSTAVKRLEEEQGTVWSNVADEVEAGNEKNES